MHLCIFSRNHAENDVVELIHTVEIPIDAFKNCRYKYCVISDANEVMKTPFEFISGSTKDGTIIDRSLKLPHSNFVKGSELKYIYTVMLTINIIIKYNST